MVCIVLFVVRVTYPSGGDTPLPLVFEVSNCSTLWYSTRQFFSACYNVNVVPAVFSTIKGNCIFPLLCIALQCKISRGIFVAGELVSFGV